MRRLTAAVVLLFAARCSAQEFTVHEQMVRMRDGIELATDVYLPGNPGEYPVLVTRTPYGKAGEKGDGEYLAKHGFVVVAQDCRGRFGSHGRFYGFINEGPDGFDTIEWAARQPWSDGQVGTFGASYLAWDQYLASMLRPPHLTAMFAMVGGAKFYDEYAYPGGIPNLGWPIWMLKSAQTSPQAPLHPEQTATMTELLTMTPVPWLKLDPSGREQIFQGFPDQLKMYQDFLAHPNFDSYWRQQGFYTAGYYADMKDVPALFLTGWYDYFSQGVLQNFQELSKRQHSMKRLVIGPWPHATGGAECGDAWFGRSAAVDQRALMADWFDHWMKSKPFRLVSDMPVEYFRMGGDDGTRTAKGKVAHGGRWLSTLSWPPEETKLRDFFLHADGRLSNAKPQNEHASKLVFDPTNPVPTLGGRYGVGAWSKSCAQDGRVDRSDVLSFNTEPLPAALDVTGRVRATVWAVSDAPSADFVAKLMDVYPNGYALTLIDGGTRAKFEKGGTPQQVSIDLGSVSNLFQAGHRLRIEIASSNFPKLEPNSRPSVSNILHDGSHASSVSLPIIGAEDQYDSAIRSTVMVPMRDGVKLATDVYAPARAQAAVDQKFAVIVTRSPYNKNGERDRGEFFARHGYVFVAQDVRGTNASEGQLEPLTQEAHDGYDTIEWAAQQKWSNGKVATTGASYLAMDQYAAAIENPPHLIVMYAAVGGANYYYESARHGGIPGLGWPVWLLLSAATDPKTDPAKRKELMDVVNHPDKWLAQPQDERAELFRDYAAQLRAYKDYYGHPGFDTYWRQIGFDTSDYYQRMKDVPMLFVSGWFDPFAEATLENFTSLRKIQKTPKRLIMGAWPHGYGKSLCGDANFGPQDELDEKAIQLDWFDHWMRGKPLQILEPEPVRYFQMGGGRSEKDSAGHVTPGGKWVTAKAWPPAAAKLERLYLDQRRTLVAREPDSNGRDEYSYDPAHPVHTLGGRNDGECIQNQNIKREDILSYVSRPLTSAKNVTGTVTVVLWAGSDATSADFTAKLIDVYPDGYAASLLDGGTRMKTNAAGPQKLVIDLGTTSNVFSPGHRIRLDISSSSFPKFEPNPNPAHNSIYHDTQHASYLELGVIEQ